ncbi:MAG: hypothetical protein AAFR90_13710, partial [Pseudomonadota bacterium]
MTDQFKPSRQEPSRQEKSPAEKSVVDINEHLFPEGTKPRKINEGAFRGITTDVTRSIILD